MWIRYTDWISTRCISRLDKCCCHKYLTKTLCNQTGTKLCLQHLRAWIDVDIKSITSTVSSRGKSELNRLWDDTFKSLIQIWGKKSPRLKTSPQFLVSVLLMKQHPIKLRSKHDGSVYLQGPHKLPPESRWLWGPLKCTTSNCNPVHVFLHFGTFGLEVLQLILASKLSELEQLENFSANNHLESKQE